MFVSVARKKPQAKLKNMFFCAKAIKRNYFTEQLALVGDIYQTETKILVEVWRNLHSAEIGHDQGTQ